jgi:hypothetical protein
VKQFKLAINDEPFFRVSQNNYFPNLLTLKKYPLEPIISIEHFIDIVSLIRNNNQTGVGVNSEKKTCRQKNNSVINSSSPGGSWL